MSEAERSIPAEEDAPNSVGEVGRDRGVKLRSIVFGLCIAVALNVLATTARFVQKGSYMIASHVPMGLLILGLLSILVCAALGRWLSRRFILSPSEWLTVFCMGFVSAIGPNYGIAGYLIGLMASPYYFATPENRWDEFIHPHLPGWLIPTNDSQAMSLFYEALPSGMSIPWDVWTVPLLWWFVFIAVLGFACLCVSVIIHRQWADNERLIFPAMTPILEIATRAGTGRRPLPDFMQGKAFWAGFGLTSFVFLWNMVSWFSPLFPTFPTAQGSFVFDLLPHNYPPLFIFLSTPVICFSYFASLDVLFSLWFFDLVFMI